VSKTVYEYVVVSKIIDKSIPAKLKEIFSNIQEDQSISTELIFDENKQYLLNAYNENQTNCKRVLSIAIKIARDHGFLKRIDDKFIPECFESLRTVSYWQSQLRGNRLKNSNANIKTTKNLYLYHLWNFNKWLYPKMFEINTLQANKQNTFVKKVEKIQFKNVEELLAILEQPFADQKNIVRIIKQYLLDKSHTDKKASYMVIIKSAIASYFEKNEQKIQISFNPKTIYNTEKEFEQSMSISDVMEFLTTGKPSVTEKALSLCKFHRGLDASTLADRFNYEAWEQIAKWFRSNDHDSWDLEKCPVPISLIRMKTDFKHIGFLDRDAIEQLQRYLDYRKTKTGKNMESGQPLFLNKFGRPISISWVFEKFARIAKRAGIQKFVEFNGKRQYKMDSHELRDLLKSTLIDSGCRMDVADHVIGHKPKDSYEKQAKLYPETLRKEYSKASKRLNIFTKFSSIVSGTDDSDELKIQLKEKLLELDRIKESRLDDEARQYRNEKATIEQQRQMRILQDTVNELKKDISVVNQTEKKSIEFCCISCSTVHERQECPACGSKLKRIFEDNIPK